MTNPEQPPTAPAPVGPRGQQPAASAPLPMRPELQYVETEPLEYHRLYRGIAKYRWWKPLLVALLTIVFFFTLNIFFGLILGAFLSMQYPLESYMEEMNRFLVIDTQDPAVVGFNLATVALTMIPSALLAMLAVGIRPIGRIFSVATRIRWGLLGRTAWFAVLTLIVMQALGMLIGLLVPVEEGAIPEPVDVDWGATAISLLLVLLLVPFQAAAEEIVFRGAAMQVIGSWLRNPWFAILIPSVAFAVAHAPTYGIWGMVSVGMMGAVAGWLTWRTGGLEAAISIHIINNYVAFAVMATGVQGATNQTDEAVSPFSLIGQALGFVFFIWITRRSFMKHGYGRERIDLLPRYVMVPDTPPAPSEPIEADRAP